MDLDLVFLGTSASMPTAQRAPAAFLVRRGGERLLFDCAEGTQRQLQRSTVGLPDLEEIFLTHFHADHFLGLPGMLKTFALRGRDERRPDGLRARGAPRSLLGLKPFLGRLPYALTTVELEAGETLERGEYRLETFAVDHGVAGARLRARRARAARAASTSTPPTRSACRPGRERGILQGGEPITLADGRVITPDAVLGPGRPGRKVVLTGDTAPSPAVVQAAHKADVLVHEATFGGRRGRARPRDAARDGRRGGRGRAARRGAAARADARLDAVLRLGARGARRARCSRTRSCRATST